MKNKIKQIISWLTDYSEKSNIQTFVVGISGGIDSAVTSTLCAETGNKVVIVSLPIYQNHEQLNLARKHAKWLLKKYKNVSFVEKDLTNLFKTFETTFTEVEKTDLSLANSRSRMRMMTLYQIAQVNNALVVGTGNKVEDFGVGFFTKYGDGGVDISPIADLMKTEVRAAARELKIINEIIDAAPTDGLWDNGQTDEEQLGASYEELEWAMNYIPTDNNELSIEKKRILELYYRWHNKNKHKMLAIPVCKIK